MKKILAFLAAAAVLFSVSAFNGFAMEHAEWGAHSFDDDNYEVFGGGIGDFSSEYAIDGNISSAWQKETDIMDRQGNIAKECFVAIQWDSKMTVESVNVWWRTSTRAVASKEGYVLQTGKKQGGEIVWSDVKGTYAYNCQYLQGDRYACDTITFTTPVETSYIRVLVKRGVDTERGYSPKVNEIEVTATEHSEPVEIPNPPAPIPPDETSSENVSSNDTSSEDVSSNEITSSDILSEDVSSELTIESTSSENVSVEQMVSSDNIDSSETSSAEQAVGEQGKNKNAPYIVLAVVSIAIIAVSLIIFLADRKKKGLSIK